MLLLMSGEAIQALANEVKCYHATLDSDHVLFAPANAVIVERSMQKKDVIGMKLSIAMEDPQAADDITAMAADINAFGGDSAVIERIAASLKPPRA